MSTATKTKAQPINASPITETTAPAVRVLDFENVEPIRKGDIYCDKKKTAFVQATLHTSQETCAVCKMGGLKRKVWTYKTLNGWIIQCQKKCSKEFNFEKELSKK